MPCNHKFSQYLHLNDVDFEPTTLIVGTFNPDWDNIHNNAKWFYGRTRNNYFWDVLPRIYEGINLRHENDIVWKQFCSRNKIGITDLLQSIEDADINNVQHIQAISDYKDSSIAQLFNDFTPVNVVSILQNNPSITQVYLTRQLGVPFWDNLWDVVTKYCDCNYVNHHVLLTPSGNARFQMNNEGGHLRDFIFENWLESWHELL